MGHEQLLSVAAMITRARVSIGRLVMLPARKLVASGILLLACLLAPAARLACRWGKLSKRGDPQWPSVVATCSGEDC